MDTSSTMTELFEQRYYKINKFLLSIIGQWPYQSRAKRHTLLGIFILLAASQIIPQIIAVVEFWDDPDIILDSIPPFVIDVGCGTKLANIVLYSDKVCSVVPKMKKIADHMQMDWMSLTHQSGIYVLQDYAEIGRKFTIAYAAGVYAVTALFMIQPVVPQILEALQFTAESQTEKFPFPVDYYGIDSESYYYYILMHSYICVAAILTVIVAVDTMFIVHVQHACGLFTVVGHQLERMDNAVPENYEHHPQSSNDAAFRQVAICIKKHSEAIEFAEMLETSHTWSFFTLVGLNMVVMSITGFQTVVKLNKSPEDAIRYAAFTVAQMVHLFFQSFFSQRLMDHSQQIHEYIYQAEWYRMPISAQKLLNLIAMRTYIPCQLTAGKFMVMSLETFTAVIKTSMSYFTLMRSMH